MELTRRDAVAALAALGGAGGVAVGYSRLRAGAGDEEALEAVELPDDEYVIETMVAVADLVYPSELAGIEPFVQEFVTQRLDDEAHAEGIRQAVAELDEQGRYWHDGTFLELSPETREQLLRESGADVAAEDPDGSVAEQIRYFVVNELLLALYASPTGGELVGIENPQGHPGGTESYQRGPSTTQG
jgi:hypothetical protein